MSCSAVPKAALTANGLTQIRVFSPNVTAEHALHDSQIVSPTRRDILAGSRPGGRGTLVSAKVPKAICACAIARKYSGSPARLVVSGGPPKGLSTLPLSLLRSKARCAPSVVRPLAGAGIHWIPAFLRLAPVPGLDARNPFRARSGPLFASLGARLGERRPEKIPIRKTATALSV